MDRRICECAENLAEFKISCLNANERDPHFSNVEAGLPTLMKARRLVIEEIDPG